MISPKDMNLPDHTGLSQFGPAYETMLANDSHAPGSVDRVLTERMVRLCEATRQTLYDGFTPTTVRDVASSKIVNLANVIVEGVEESEKQVDCVAAYVSRLTHDVRDESLEEMRFGGTEEEIIARGSDWCTDLTRVGCILSQAVSIPARMVMLYNTDQAYSGHVIIEVSRSSTWGAVDPTAGIVYRDQSGSPVTVWDLMQNADLVHEGRKPGGSESIYGDPDQFLGVAISNYSLADRDSYDYTITGLNGYCRSILEMSEKGWPGGLRWLHGENSEGK